MEATSKWTKETTEAYQKANVNQASEKYSENELKLMWALRIPILKINKKINNHSRPFHIVFWS